MRGQLAGEAAVSRRRIEPLAEPKPVGGESEVRRLLWYLQLL